MVIVFGLESEFCFTKIGTAVSTDTAVENISYYFLRPKLHTRWIISKLFIQYLPLRGGLQKGYTPGQAYQ